MVSLLLWLVFTNLLGSQTTTVLSDVLETIQITENNASITPLANLSAILLNKIKIPEFQMKDIVIVPISDASLAPFKLKNNQLTQPSNGVDRESVCSEKPSKISKTMCKIDECCKLIGFQYSNAAEINMFFVLVKIEDKNDQIPQFSPIKRPFIRIPENVEVGFVIDLPIASDSDSEQYSIQRYSYTNIYQSDPNDDFRLYLTNDIPPRPQLIVQSKLDFERTSKYAFKLNAYDYKETQKVVNGIGHSCSITIEIEIEDLNDNIPKFNQLSYTANIDENKRMEQLIKYTISDPDSGRNGMVTVTINDKTDELMKKFQIVQNQRNEGYLGLINQLDYENDPQLYEFSLIATDQGTPPLSSTAQVKIYLKNVNDNGPKIKFKRLGHSISNSVSITEGLKPYSLVVEVRVTDSDTPLHMISCKLVDYTDLFLLDSPNKYNPLLDFKPFNLKTITIIDRESSHGVFIRVTIQCNDGDVYHPIITNESLNIQVQDINDNTPLFSLTTYVGTVEENQINSVVNFIKPIIVTDKDSGPNAKFEFKLEDFTNRTDSSEFLCDRFTGKIVTQKSLDYELRNSYKFKMVAIDTGLEPLNSSATITINVVDINDNAPKFLDSHYVFNVLENVTVGSKIGVLSATDRDTYQKNKEILYYMESKSDNMNAIEIDRLTGDIRTRKPLDRESFESISFKVVARNPNSYSSQMVRSSESEVDVIIKILDVNDNAPTFKARPHTKPNVEFVIEQYVEGSTCAELPYTVHDADDGINSGQNCCLTTLENDHNKLFSLMTDTPTYICLSKKPEKCQSLTVTLVAKDKPLKPEESLTARVSFQVIIKTDPNVNPNRNPTEPSTVPSYNEQKNLIIIGILTTVVLVVIIIIIIIIIIIKRCSVSDRDCDNNKCYQAIDLSVNRNEGTKVNYMMSEQGNLLHPGMSPGKATMSRGYLTNSQYSDSLHKTLSRNMQQIPSNVSSPFTPPQYHQIMANQGVRIIQNPNRFNDQYIYEWPLVSDDRDRSISRHNSNIDKMRSMSPTKSSSIHNSSKILNDEQQDCGYQILNPFGMSSSPPQQFVNYSPESLIPCENEMSPNDGRSLTLLNNFFDENNNGGHGKNTPGTMKKNYFQTTFV